MTIYDIAKEAGVAASTVSRVINNKPGIKMETRLQIQEILKKYNYMPNVTAQGLATQSTKMIGILMADIRVEHHTNSAHVIEQALTQMGYCCITMSTGTSDEKKAEYIRILQQRRVDGVILMGSMFMTEAVRKSIQEYLANVPVVIANGYLDLPNVSGIIVDEDCGIEKCVDLLIRKGRRKIAFVLDVPSPANHNKQQGFCNGMKKIGISEEELWLYDAGGSTFRNGYDVTQRVFDEHPDVDGILYSIDLIAAGGIRAAFDRKISVPEQVSMIGVDNSIYGEICIPQLTTLDNKMTELSELAASLLRDGLEGKLQSKKMMLFSEIIEREST